MMMIMMMIFELQWMKKEHSNVSPTEFTSSPSSYNAAKSFVNNVSEATNNQFINTCFMLLSTLQRSQFISTILQQRKHGMMNQELRSFQEKFLTHTCLNASTYNCTCQRCKQQAINYWHNGSKANSFLLCDNKNPELPINKEIILLKFSSQFK